MTAGELAIRLLEDYGDEASIETMIDAIVILVERDEEGYRANALETTGKIDELDPVLACFRGAKDNLRDASLAMYASFK